MISSDRLATYTKAAASTGGDVLELYIWDRDMAAAVLAHVAILEVAMRNAMHAQLSTLFDGSDWYARDIGLDDRAQSAIATAWGRVTADRRTPGRVVAQLMFGFWRNLLEAGGTAGKGPLTHRCDYEQLWRAGLRRAFPGGRAEAAAEQSHFSRHWTLDTVSVVHALRNRAAHHEPLVDGFPLPGQRSRTGQPVRLTTLEGHQACLKLARLLDRDLGTWLSGVLGSSQCAQAAAARRAAEEVRAIAAHRSDRQPGRIANAQNQGRQKERDLRDGHRATRPVQESSIPKRAGR